MTRTEKIEALEKLVAELYALEDPESYHREFSAWRDRAIRRIVQIFGNPSLQVNHFVRTQYLRPSLASHRAYRETDGSKSQVSEVVQRFFSYINSLKEEIPNDSKHQASASIPERKKNVFISHSSKDDEIGKEVINLLQLIGIKHSYIFYTSVAGYGIPLGKDWVETLKSEVSSGGVVISLLSDNYFTSQICLLEMGATWVLSKLHIPILIPPLTFKDTNDVINATQGFQILDRLRWSSLKRELEKLFDLEPLPEEKWEPQRDAIMDRIRKLLPTQ